MGIQKYKERNIPKRSDQQKEVNSRSIQRFIVNANIENGFDVSNFTKTNSTINGNLYTENKDFAPT